MFFVKVGCMNFFSLKDRVIVITGASGLLGKEHAYSVAAAGGIPILIDIDELGLKALKKSLKEKFGISAHYFKTDITKENQIIASLEKIKKRLGKIDGLINNAARNPSFDKDGKKNFSRLENFSIGNWNKDLAVGLTGAFLASKHFGNALANNKKGGVIINISSDLGIIAPNQNLYKNDKYKQCQQPVKPVTYSVVKAGVIGLTKYLATYWPEKVRCNALAPGGVFNDQDEDFIRKVKQLIPQNRLAEKDEYRGSIIYLLSDASKYMNGAVLSVDGGRSIW